MARTQTMVQLTDELIDLLDAEARRRGISRSALVRDVLVEALRDEREAEINRAIVDGYTRIPPGTPDEWGNLEEQGAASGRDLGARLDAEERDAGMDSW